MNIKWITIFGLGLVLAVCALPGCGGSPGKRDFDAGLREMARGRDVRAKALFEKSITLRPGSDANAEAYNYLGLLSSRLGQIEAAVESFEQSHRLNPELAAPVYNLAVLMYRSGKEDRSADLFAEAADLDSRDTRAQEYLASLFIRRQKWAEARRTLFNALARAPQSSRILTALAVVDYRAGNPDKSVFYLMQALEKDSDYPPALFNLGLIYESDSKDCEKALSLYRGFIETTREGPQADLARAAAGRIALAIETGAVASAPAPAEDDTLPPAVQTVSNAVSETRAADAPLPTSEDLLAQAEVAAKQGLIPRALNLCLETAARAERAGDAVRQERALRAAAILCPDADEAHSALGSFLAGRGDYEAAVRSFKQALVLNPKSEEAQLGLAGAAAQTGEFDTALVTLKQLAQADPGNAEALWMLAQIYDRSLGVEDKAAQAYRQFEKLFPGDPRVVKASERVAALTPPPPEPPPQATNAPASPSPHVLPEPAAEEPSAPAREPVLQFKKPLYRNTKAAVQAYNRGTLYQEREDWDRAIYYYIRALENDDTFVTAFYNLGTVYWAKGDLGAAREAYEGALQIRSDSVNARFNLALIQYQLKDNEAAIGQLKTLLRINPTYAQAFYLMGVIYAGDESTKDIARQAYGRFLELAPNDPNAASVRQWMAQR